MNTKLDKSNNFIKSFSNLLSRFDLYIKHYIITNCNFLNNLMQNLE